MIEFGDLSDLLVMTPAQRRAAMTTTAVVLLNPAIAPGKRRGESEIGLDRVTMCTGADRAKGGAPKNAQRSAGSDSRSSNGSIATHVDEGRGDAPYAGASVFRISSTTVIPKEPTFGVTLGIVAQGSKLVRVHGRTLEIDPSH